MTPLETEADPNIRVGPLRWGRPQHWQHDLDLSNLEQVRTCLNQNGYDTSPLFDLMLRPETQAAYDANTEEAIRLSVFGSPTYIVDGDIFYGQDNLVLVERALEKPFG